MTTPQRELARTLITNGYKIVPIVKGEKYPMGMGGWQKLNYTLRHLEEDTNLFLSAGIGIICGEVMGIDIDVLDPSISAKIKDWCWTNIGSAPERIGRAPKSLLVYRKKEPVAKQFSVKYEDEIFRPHVIEFLGKGQQFLAHAIHPNTGKPYTWPQKDLTLIPLEELTFIEDHHISELMKYFDAIRQPDWTAVTMKSSTGGGEGELQNKAPIEDFTGDDVRILLTHFQSESKNYDSWLKMGMALHHQYEGNRIGFDLWDAWSQNSDNYDSKAAKNKWASFNSSGDKANITIRTYLHRMAKNCAVDAVKNKTPSAIVLASLEGFLARYIHIAKGNQVFDKLFPLQECLTSIEFHATHANKPYEYKNKNGEPKITTLARGWTNHPERLTAQDIVFNPGKEITFMGDDGAIHVNSYHPPTFADTKSTDKLCVFNAHIAYLFPIEAEREWFLDWMGFNIQFPAKRCKVTPLHVTNLQGTGRGWLGKVLTLLVGEKNCASTLFATLCGNGGAGPFQEYLAKSVLCLVDEVKEEGTRSRINDRLKSILEADKLEVNIKHGFKGTASVYTNFFFQSNHWDALILSDEDRRINVLTGPIALRSTERYNELFDWLKTDGVGQLYHWLKRRDISNFDFRRCMNTIGRSRMMRNSTSTVDSVCQELYQHPPVVGITQKQMKSYVIMRLQELGDFEPSQTLNPSLKKARDKANLEEIPGRSNGRIPTYYILDPVKFKEMTAHRVIKENEEWAKKYLP